MPHADSHSIRHVGGDGMPSRRVESAPMADAALGAQACAYCDDIAAAPTLAGDRNRGPDHLYLVCDRCGGRWERSRVDDVRLASDGPSAA
jgi:hypothetical protein